MEAVLGVLQAAAGGEVAAVFGAVGVADHHDLPVAAAPEMIAVDGLVEDRRECLVGMGEVVDLLEQRHDRDVGVGGWFATAGGLALGPPPQPEHRQHVGRAPRQADDRAADTPGAEADRRGVEHAEQPQRIEGERAEPVFGDTADAAERVDEQPAAGNVVE